MDKEKFAQDLEAILEQINNADTEELSKLAKITGLDLRKDFVAVDLSGEDLSGENLKGVNLCHANLKHAKLEGANLEGANLKYAKLEEATFGNNLGINQELRREFEARGAKFIDFPEDPASIKVLVPR
ncbi:MAG: pentapeptide repeat-containing protein [Cyanobacteria bacterium P01_F01_bin.143]